MDVPEPCCRYCKKEMPAPRIRGKNPAVFIFECKRCDSEQSYYDNGTIKEWSFMVDKKYCIHYWPGTKDLKIVEYNAHGRPQKYVLEMKTDADPDYMTPESMTEQRIKTIIVFS